MLSDGNTKVRQLAVRILQSQPPERVAEAFLHDVLRRTSDLARTDPLTGMGNHRVLMQQHAIYTVISPEGCASILWRTADEAATGAYWLSIRLPALADQGMSSQSRQTHS